MRTQWVLIVCHVAFCAKSSPLETDDDTLPIRNFKLANAKISAEAAIGIAKEASANAHQAFLKRRAHLTISGCTSCPGKEYSEPCPTLWTELSDGTCQPPLNYKGPCSTKQTFVGASALEKEEAELACQICWPCPNEEGCARDWSRPCPFSYSPEALDVNTYANAVGPTCIADLDYEGGCESSVQFHDEEEKQQFAQRCSVTWPCASSCESSVETVCPKDWAHIGESICAAPSYYKEAGCGVLHSFQGWTPAMKTEYARRCRVVWPCQADASEEESGEVANGPVKRQTCELNLESCPRTWMASPDGFCRPPPFAVGPCTQPVQLGSMTSVQKLQWSGSCLLSWPCKGEVVSTHSLPGARVPWNVKVPVDGPIDDERVHV